MLLGKSATTSVHSAAGPRRIDEVLALGGGPRARRGAIIGAASPSTRNWVVPDDSAASLREADSM